MKLGLMLAYSSGTNLNIPVRTVQLAERLGYDSVWTAETWGTDAITPLAYLAGQTKRIRLGTSVIQLAARTAACTAMTMATLDAIAGGGRAIIGIGMSGPQVVEGWYGRPWGRPYWQLRDYTEIIRKILRREDPVAHEGREISLPYTGEGSSGLGKALRPNFQMNPDIPIWLGSVSETNVRLTAEIADGWFIMHFAPGLLDTYKSCLDEGFARAGGGKSMRDLEIQAVTRVVITDDVCGEIQRHKRGIAFSMGGMGHPKKNFHNDMMVRRGYPDAAARILELFQAGRRSEAAEAVPDEYVDEELLLGPPARIRERYRAWEDSGLTGLSIWGGSEDEEMLTLMADVAGLEA